MSFEYRLVLIMIVGGVLILTSGNINIFEVILSTNNIEVTPGPMKNFNQAAITNALSDDFLVTFSNQQYPIKPTASKFWFEKYYRSYTGRDELRPNFANIEADTKKIAKKIDRLPANGHFKIDENGQITQLVPANNGIKINTTLSAANIAKALIQGGNSADLAYEVVEPPINPSQLKRLGIKTLLGKGQSDFNGSSASRIHNIKIGSNIFDGIVVKPGEEFSFNRLLGPVEASSGYQYELVVKNKSLIPEYGGGLCQVSTTLFRAAATAGLPIIERHSHSLPVRYYHPQGFDATIYPGVSDLRFKNDTPNNILIQAEVSGTSLSFEIYGSSNGRKVSLDGPHVYDSQPDGSMKTWLKRIVTLADGTQHKDIFYSIYKSPSLFARIRNPLE